VVVVAGRFLLRLGRAGVLAAARRRRPALFQAAQEQLHKDLKAAMVFLVHQQLAAAAGLAALAETQVGLLAEMVV
jgi:hypothetical protein